MLNVDGISIYTRTYVTTDSDQIGQVYLSQEELKVRRIGPDAMMEQDAVHIGYEADVEKKRCKENRSNMTSGHRSSSKGDAKKKNWERMGFTREDLIPTNITLAAANLGASYVAGRTSLTVLHMGGRDLLENLDDSDQFILGPRFCQEFRFYDRLEQWLNNVQKPRPAVCEATN